MLYVDDNFDTVFLYTDKFYDHWLVGQSNKLRIQNYETPDSNLEDGRDSQIDRRREVHTNASLVLVEGPQVSSLNFWHGAGWGYTGYLILRD